MSDIDGIRAAARALDTETDLEPLLDRARRARFVLLGAPGDGGREYQSWRARITRDLIAEHGFGFVAVEADGPELRPVDAAVRLIDDADPGAVLTGRTGWPSWPLADADTVALCRWLREHNATLPHRRRVGWYGLDAHPRHASLRTIVDYLTERAPEQLATALSGGDAPPVPDEHLGPVTARLALVHTGTADGEYAAQDEKLRAGAEGYYHAMLTGGDFARDTRTAHLVATLEDLADHHGPNSRAVVWASADQVGHADSDHLNLGSHLRERYGRTDVYTIGMVGGGGAVTAAAAFGEPPRTTAVPAPEPGSTRARLLESGLERAWFPLDEQPADRWQPPLDAHDALLWFASTTPTDRP